MKIRTLIIFLVVASTFLLSSCTQKDSTVATGPAYTIEQWPYSVPARISDEDNSDLFLMALGNVSTDLAQGTFDPVKDEITLNDGTIIRGWYRDSLGLKYYNPINKKIFPLPPSGLCTWYYYYQHINEEEVRLLARWIKDNLKDYGATYVQIDDGWQKEREDGGHGSRDWTGVDQAFPSGMADLATYIREQGLVPGIWIAPHGQSSDSVVMANPGVFLFRPDSTSASSTWEGKYLMDPTSEVANEYLFNLFKMMVDWGYDYFKIDGQPIVVREYDRANEFMQSPGKDNEELYRKTLEIIREAIGPDRYLLGCWGIPVEGMGIMDGSRTGGDVVLGWSGFDVALMPTMRYYYQHNIAWYTDPDVMMVRQPLTLPQAQVWATLQGLTGQALMTSDRLTDLSDERVELVKRVYPAVDIRPVDLFPSNTRKTIWDLKVNHLDRQYDIVGLFNFGENEIKHIVLNWADLGLNENVPYHVFDFWNNEYLGAWEKGMSFEIDPTSCRVVTLLPDNGEIQLMSTSRHITQGWVDLEELEFDSGTLAWSGTSNIIKGDPYQVHFVYPRGEYFEIDKILVKGARGLETTVTNHQGWSTITVESPQTTKINWSVTFKPAYSYKYETRQPDRLSVQSVGIDAVRLSWNAQYYLNAGYQVYLDGELQGYSPSTSFIINNIDPHSEHTADVRTVWVDGEINKRPGSGNQEFGVRFSIESLLPGEVLLTSLENESGDGMPGMQASLNGRKYTNSLVLMGGRAREYSIHGLFKSFQATVGIDDNSFIPEGSDSSLRFRVAGDGKILYTSPVLKKGDVPLRVNVDVTGISNLTLETLSSTGRMQGRRGLMGDWLTPVLVR